MWRGAGGMRVTSPGRAPAYRGEESACLGDFRERKLCVEAGKMQENLTGLGVWEKFGVPGTCGE